MKRVQARIEKDWVLTDEEREKLAVRLEAEKENKENKSRRRY